MTPKINETCNLFEIDGNEFARKTGSYSLDEIIDMFNEQNLKLQCKNKSKGQKL